MINEDELRKFIGNKFKQKRLERNQTQAELAEILGLSNRHVVRIEKGEVGINLNMLLQMSEAFDVYPAWFLEGAIEETNEYNEKFYLLNQKEQEAITLIINSILEGK